MSSLKTIPLLDSAGELICGVDEAGRGPLAGPVFAAAVILDPSKPITGLRDSKKLSPTRRDQLALIIQRDALAWSIAQCSAAEIDALNILQATMLAMRRAIEGLSMTPTLALIDGNRCPVTAFVLRRSLKVMTKYSRFLPRRFSPRPRVMRCCSRCIRDTRSTVLISTKVTRPRCISSG